MTEIEEVKEEVKQEQQPKKKISKEKQKEYNSTYYAENRDKKYMCEICCKEVNYFNKSKHIKSAIHQRLSRLCISTGWNRKSP